MPRPLRSEIARSIANLAIEVGDPGRMAKARRIHRLGGSSSVEIEARLASVSVSDGEGVFVVELALEGAVAAGMVPTSDQLKTCLLYTSDAADE